MKEGDQVPVTLTVENKDGSRQTIELTAGTSAQCADEDAARRTEHSGSAAIHRRAFRSP